MSHYKFFKGKNHFFSCASPTVFRTVPHSSHTHIKIHDYFSRIAVGLFENPDLFLDCGILGPGNRRK